MIYIYFFISNVKANPVKGRAIENTRGLDYLLNCSVHVHVRPLLDINYILETKSQYILNQSYLILTLAECRLQCTVHHIVI